MTKIFIHGQLSEQFPEVVSMALRKASDAVDAIDAVYGDFRIAIARLTNIGIHYGMVIDGQDVKVCDIGKLASQPEELHFVPMICGSGVVALGVGVGVAAFGATAGGIAIAGTAIAFTASQVIMAGVMIAGMGLMMMLAPKPEMQRPESTVSGLSESSYLGSSTANLMQQGAPLPIGYGRLRVGSALINTTTKSFQVTKTQATSMLANTSGKPDDNTQISTKQGKKTR